MNSYEFTLVFTLPAAQSNPEAYLDALFEAGCDDAMIGTGVAGRIALEFERAGENALNTLLSAIHDVKNAIPNANLAECRPDLIGVTGIAAIFKLSRQAVLKAIKNNPSFPAPVHSGSSDIWHLYQVVDWAQKHGKLASRLDDVAIVSELSAATYQLNLARELYSLGGVIAPAALQAFQLGSANQVLGTR
ncbi:DNA-binding protein [Maribrevibacterium harenarium]|uniref:DNA-binding protein n=1 Tax=Maribrevibacterium harenarium TaxID=2589817 RepID=A0A501X021_9GAMM|nr:DNA-binding protein [Maribrevibacterium harenarium]TPE54125.1 DNA-binding protein [Maribrevibacterium harenarium]